MAGKPQDVLEETLGDVVSVRLKDGEFYAGILAGYDQHMNLVLEPTEERGHSAMGDLQGATPLEDTTIIRGDNVVSIQP